ncbi:hypothetical protein SacmaDRAFT_5191 [Saccharomonospora marina XMU15]|uniref:Uncharacterized protein n=1 Tax=Saccharomonospora marina XMU15 TaxID=882083 RepID=H5X524_9PSEU|nr:hypothetical protein [Saccharomonospora marina]EHR53356.1 hypothetical protein SacmaDRAFT_5191 [Saccharomonospora marina XMU15]
MTSALSTSRSLHAGAVVGGHEVDFIASHREDNDTPVAMAVTLTVPVSLEDVAAMLWIAVNGGATFEELDADYTREFVAETLLNVGGLGISDARLEMAAAKPGTGEYAIAQQVRRHAREVFGASVPAPRARVALAMG